MNFDHDFYIGVKKETEHEVFLAIEGLTEEMLSEEVVY